MAARRRRCRGRRGCLVFGSLVAGGEVTVCESGYFAVDATEPSAQRRAGERSMVGKGRVGQVLVGSG